MFNTEVIAEKKQYTGIAPCKVLAINPSGQWLKENGFRRDDTDLDYSYDFGNDNSGTKVMIFVEGIEDKNVRGQVDFLISANGQVAKSGKNLYIDTYGNSSWAESLDDVPEWFKKDSAIHGSKGLENLIKFIRTWARIDRENAVSFDLAKVMTGNMLDLQALPSQSEAISKAQKGYVFGIQLMFGVNDKGYSTIYNQAFVRIDSKNVKHLKTAIEGEYTLFKADYQKSLNFKEYVPSLDVETPTPDAEPNNSDSDIGLPDIANNGDDLPF